MVGHRKAVQKADYCHAIQSDLAQNFAGLNKDSNVKDAETQTFLQLTGPEHICTDIDYLVLTTKGSIHSGNTPSLVMGPDGWEVFLVDAILQSGPLPIIDLGSAGGAVGLSLTNRTMPLQSDFSSSAKQRYNVERHDVFLQKNSNYEQLGRKAGGGTVAAKQSHHYYYHHRHSIQSLASSQACI
jgi:hypothetical protein